MYVIYKNLKKFQQFSIYLYIRFIKTTKQLLEIMNNIYNAETM